MLELYHWEPRVNSLKPLICLREKGLDFRSHYVDLLEFEQLRPDFLNLNPEGQVPVLVHDGKVVTESTFMLNYIEETFPVGSLTPETPADRYRALVWGKLADDYLAPAIGILGWHSFTAPEVAGKDFSAVRARLEPLSLERRAMLEKALDDSYTEEDLANSRRRLTTAAERVEAGVADSDWLVGDQYSLADIAVFAMASTLPVLLPDVVNDSATPNTMAWLERIAARPAVQDALAGARQDLPENIFAPGPEPGRWG